MALFFIPYLYQKRMFHLPTKPQNRVRILTVFLIGGFMGYSNLPTGPISILGYAINGAIMLFICVILGHWTNLFLTALGINPFASTEDDYIHILDKEVNQVSKKEQEDQQDSHALNYAIIWVLFFFLLSILS